MQCGKCEEKAVYHAQGTTLCKTHFLDYVEKKVDRTIKEWNLFQEGDVVCVAASGGKDSLTALYLTKKFCDEHHLQVFALAIDEGIAGYRDHTLEDLKAFCLNHSITLHSTAFKDSYGKTLDEMRQKSPTTKPCMMCGIFRRTSLNRHAKTLGATKLVTGHNLDDESQSFLMNTLLGNMGHNASLGPVTGLGEQTAFVQRVKPLYFLTEQETRLYTFLKGWNIDFTECPNVPLSYRSKVRDFLNQMESQFPGTKHALVNGFLSLLPELKNKVAGRQEFKQCTRCGDPCKGEVCNACKMEEHLELA